MGGALPRTRCFVALVLLVIGAGSMSRGQTQSGAPNVAGLKQLTLDQLGSVEVTSASKEPEEVWKTPAAIYVLTEEDIRRSGATNIPDVLRLVPGVEVSRIDSDTW